MKVSELIGTDIDYWVAKAEGLPLKHDPMGFGAQSPGGYWVWPDKFPPAGGYMQVGKDYSPSTHWSQGGPIIEREEISIGYVIPAMKDSIWQASPSLSAKGAGGKSGSGPTPLIAAMRCYVASKFGEEVTRE